MTRVIDLVDSIEYTTSNCFAHQLHRALHDVGPVETVALADIDRRARPDRVVCRLKQRTLHRELGRLARWAGDAPVVVFDQDPWHAYMDDSPYRGVYRRAAAALNVRSFAVTTRVWADRIRDDGLPGTFVRMWVLPEYCDRGTPYDERAVPVGFVGSLHPHRLRLFTELRCMGVDVQLQGGNGLPYARYLQALSGLRVFVHSEDCELRVDGAAVNLRDALWIKDVEAAARGCFTVRNAGADPGSYYDGIETVRLYEDPREVPGLLRAIEKMDPQERLATIDRSVEHIRRSDRWHETAAQLLGSPNNRTWEGKMDA